MDNDIRKIVADDPTSAALYSKLVANFTPVAADGTGRKDAIRRGAGDINAISETTKAHITSNEDAISIFPDLMYMSQLMTSAVMAPNDMVTANLIVSSDSDILPAPTRNVLCDVVKKALVEEYGAEEEVYRIIHSVLFDRGAHVKVIIPESSLDDVIHSRGISSESAHTTKLAFESAGIGVDFNVSNLGFLLPPTDVKSSRETYLLGMESFFSADVAKYPSTELSHKDKAGTESYGLGVQLIDNFNILKIPQAIKQLHKQRTKSLLRAARGGKLSFESAKNSINLKDVQRNPNTKTREVISIGTERESTRRSIGRALVLDWPIEATIPIYTPGDPSDHHAYILLADRTGSPVTVDGDGITHDMVGASISEAVNGTGSATMAKDLLARANAQTSDMTKPVNIRNILEIYSQALDEEVNRSLERSGINGKFDSRTIEGLSKVMLFRTLQNSATRMLYVPAELVQYFAHRYHKNGVGRSYMDDMRILLGLRAGYYIARILGSIKNSISVTRATVTVDEDDAEPQTAITRAMSLIAASRSNWLPNSSYDINGLTQWVQNLGVEVQIDEHPLLPNTKIEYDNVKMDHNIPDESLEETFRTQCSLVVGVPPEMVDSAKGPDFATTVEQQSLIMSKRAFDIQKALNPHWTQYFRKVTTNDQILRQEIAEVLKRNLSSIRELEKDTELVALASTDEAAYLEYLVDNFIDGIDVKLPPPEMTSQVTQGESFTNHMESVEKAIDYVFSTDLMPQELVGELSGSVEYIRAQYIAYYAREWMSKNGYMSELSELVTKDADGKVNFNINQTVISHIETAMQSTNRFMEDVKGLRAAANADVQARGDTGMSGGGDAEPDGEVSGDGDPFGASGFDGDSGEPPTVTDDGGEAAPPQPDTGAEPNDNSAEVPAS